MELLDGTGIPKVRGYKRYYNPGTAQLIIDTIHSAAKQGYKVLFPWQVQAFCPIDMNEATFRHYMAKLAEEGELVRLGQRKGYSLN